LQFQTPKENVLSALILVLYVVVLIVTDVTLARLNTISIKILVFYFVLTDTTKTKHLRNNVLFVI